MYGYVVRAEYEDGFTLEGDGLELLSPFGHQEHIVRAIVNGRATEAGHGPLVRWSLVPEHPGMRYDLDWKAIAHLTNIRPVYFRRMQRTLSQDGRSDSGPMCAAHGFGFQFQDGNGENVQVIEEVT